KMNRVHPGSTANLEHPGLTLHTKQERNALGLLRGHPARLPRSCPYVSARIRRYSSCSTRAYALSYKSTRLVICIASDEETALFSMLRGAGLHLTPRPTAYTFPCRICAARCSEARIDSARIVMVGFCQPQLTKLAPSTTNRFLMSWLWHHGFSTLVFGSVPILHVPNS